jgi:dinuclear metal center YbgI/SA1388 family protein
VNLNDVVEYLDGYLRAAEIPDYTGAVNGLEVESSGAVTSVAVAVDASQATIDAAAAAGANLLLVHHGLFWDRNPRITGRRYRRIHRLISADIALYAAHLPLDVHPEVGNNVVLAREIGIEIQGRFGEYKGQEIGYWGTLEISREALAARLEEILGGRVKVVPGGPGSVRRIGVITGGGAGEIGSAIDAGLDALVTGEGAHHNYFDAEEGGINLFLGGHYATEIWGVRELGRLLERELGIPSTFIDRPTGL